MCMVNEMVASRADKLETRESGILGALSLHWTSLLVLTTHLNVKDRSADRYFLLEDAILLRRFKKPRGFAKTSSDLNATSLLFCSTIERKACQEFVEVKVSIAE